MNLYERQQFDFLLFTAVERYVERLIQRNEGAENALARLRTDPQSDTIQLASFVDAIFQDFLLANTAGACFILQALETQTLPAPIPGKIEKMLIAMTKTAFGKLLLQKTDEFLEQETMYGT